MRRVIELTSYYLVQRGGTTGYALPLGWICDGLSRIYLSCAVMLLIQHTTVITCVCAYETFGCHMACVATQDFY